MRELEWARKLAVGAGDFLYRNRAGRRRVRFKSRSPSNIVTDMDHASEERIIRVLRREFPDHAIVAEERGAVGDSASCWYVDPLDGTTNYAHGLPLWGVSIAFEDRGRLEAGAIYVPALGEIYWARRGGGAFRNGRAIRVSRTAELRGALLATGFPHRPKDRMEQLRYFTAFLPRAQALRRPGTASIDLAWTAAGALDGYWEFRLGSWDIAAGILLVQEAGGHVTDFQGRPVDIHRGQVVVANPRLHRKMLSVLQRARLS